MAISDDAPSPLTSIAYFSSRCMISLFLIELVESVSLKTLSATDWFCLVFAMKTSAVAPEPNFLSTLKLPRIEFTAEFELAACIVDWLYFVLIKFKYVIFLLYLNLIIN